jgi:hypothetical protein
LTTENIRKLPKNEKIPKNAKESKINFFILIQKYVNQIFDKTSIAQLALENNAKCIEIPALVLIMMIPYKIKIIVIFKTINITIIVISIIGYFSVFSLHGKINE